MANIKSAKKRILLSEVARKKNSHFKSKMKTLIKKAFVAIEEKTADVEQVVRNVLKTIDKTSSKGIIHKNTAARQKSRVAKALHSGVIPDSAKEKMAIGKNKKATTKSKAAAQDKTETTVKEVKAPAAKKPAKPKTVKAEAAPKKAASPKKKAAAKK